MTADSVATSEDDVQAVRQWVRLSCTDPGTLLPALAEIAGELRLSAPVVRSVLKQLAAAG
ncbi:GntR family transcriptional regulator [Streptomyces mirabilis]|uniref:GntR family transcriptional regulator n=1 Tax=Streptomyces mirabilis TaxID=68239 RepID=UPI0036CDB9C9